MATTCPISKSAFMEKATPVEVQVAGTTITATPKDFTTGSFGWYLNGKVTINVDDKPLTVQVGANLTVVGSKDAPR
jgi:hypothetical protein